LNPMTDRTLQPHLNYERVCAGGHTCEDNIIQID
jgi:hypothetical protein